MKGYDRTQRASAIMNSNQTLSVIFGINVICAAALHAIAPNMAPDTIFLKNGTEVKGIIVENTSDSVTIQQAYSEVTVSKEDIVRIRDEADDSAYFASMQRRGSLPPWRLIVNDLRLHDKIKSFEQVPATVIAGGEFKNVPYQSFRINGDIEMNIYGDPDDPAAVEVGVYGRRKNDRRLHQMLRQYLAGYLTSRDELRALYSIPPTGGSADAGDMRLSVTLPDDPDSYGAWWVGVSNPKQLDQIRMSDEDYAKLVRPVEEVFDKDGKVLSSAWRDEEVSLSRRISQMGEDAQVFLRGFYRDENGRFQMIFQDLPKAP